MLAALVADVILVVALLMSISIAANLAPQRWAPLFGIPLPLPALLIAGWAVDRDPLARRPRIGTTLAMAVDFGPVVLFRRRHESMRSRHVAPAPVRQYSPTP